MNPVESNVNTENIGNYILNDVQVSTESVYPFSPTIIIQKTGGPIVDKNSIIDVQSELLNITRKNSNVPEEKWLPAKNNELNQNYVPLSDILFNQESTLLNDPPLLLRGNVKNRWINLHLNPQENSIEPFDRLGKNTYLELIDTHDC